MSGPDNSESGLHVRVTPPVWAEAGSTLDKDAIGRSREGFDQPAMASSASAARAGRNLPANAITAASASRYTACVSRLWRVGCGGAPERRHAVSEGVRTMIRSTFVLSALAFAGCSSIIEGTSQEITVNTNPSGASCAFMREGQPIGTVHPTPGAVLVKKTKYDITIVCDRPGFDQATYLNHSGAAGATFGNIVLAVGLVGRSTAHPARTTNTTARSI